MPSGHPVGWSYPRHRYQGLKENAHPAVDGIVHTTVTLSGPNLEGRHRVLDTVDREIKEGLADLDWSRDRIWKENRQT